MALEVTAGEYVTRDFRFASGEVMPELRLAYQAIGTPGRDAVLVMHGTGGSGAQFLQPHFAEPMFGPGGLLDAAHHFLVLPDAIGHGRSSKPSDGLRAGFPRYAYDDMVRAQHLLLTEHLDVDHLRLVMGTSMGGMHSWLWGIRYPDFMDGLVPLASLPTQIAGRNRMIRTMMIDSIRLDPTWQGGDYGAQPQGLRAAVQLLFMMSSSPLTQQRAAPTRDEADRFIVDWLEDRLGRIDANDFLYQIESSRDYDPSPELEKIVARLLAINSADDLVNPPELGIMERLMPRVKRGRYVLLPITEATRGHGTHTWPSVWAEHFSVLLAELPRG
jgi:homoserine O-acetyltransferase